MAGALDKEGEIGTKVPGEASLAGGVVVVPVTATPEGEGMTRGAGSYLLVLETDGRSGWDKEEGLRLSFKTS